jgi:hypothetical protein
MFSMKISFMTPGYCRGVIFFIVLKYVLTNNTLYIYFQYVMNPLKTLKMFQPSKPGNSLRSPLPCSPVKKGPSLFSKGPLSAVMAERQRFELWVHLRVHMLSRHAP